ncbi:hypothetical protein Tco_0739118, partial [Tanacetum coccineum]
VHYKIIAKILANRLAKVIDKIVSHEQSAFIAGRQILDGPLILSKIVEWFKKEEKVVNFQDDDVVVLENSETKEEDVKEDESDHNKERYTFEDDDDDVEFDDLD